MSEAPERNTERAQRQPRVEAVEDERRRRKAGPTGDPTMARFGITDDILDLKKYVYRAAVDSGMRLHNLTVRDDYDFVTLTGEKADGVDAKGVVRYQAGVLDGKPQYAYLLRKLRKFADEDRAVSAGRVKDELKARLTETPDDAPDKSYTPGKG